jgi:hypothetical protein
MNTSGTIVLVRRPALSRPSAEKANGQGAYTGSDRRDLSVPERVMLFCLASGTDWQRASITGATAQQMMIRGLIERQAAGSFVLSDQGRAVLEALMMRAATRGR